MEREHLLLPEISMYNKGNTIAFAYERMGDVLKAMAFLSFIEDNKKELLLENISNSGDSKYINFLTALSSIMPDYPEYKCEIFDKFPDLFKSSEMMQTSFIEGLKYRNIDINIISDKIRSVLFKNVDDTLLFESILVISLDFNTGINSKLLHEILSPLELDELTFRWSNAVNNLYDDYKLLDIYSSNTIDTILSNEHTGKLEYLVILCWLLSSSYPAVRDEVTRAITTILYNNQDLTLELFAKFENTKDLYILERLLCAIYGVVLVSENITYIKGVAESILKSIFKDKKPPFHIHVRQYARLIVEKAYSLKTITNEQYQLSLPPYSSEYDLVPISDEEIKLK